MKKMTKKKKLFRKVTALAAVIALGASLAGCGSSGEETTQRYSWPLATASPEDTVTQIFAEKFAEEISELSDGRMKIQVYANSTLGGDRDLLETCADGDIPFVVQNTAPQVSFMGDLAVFDLPCVFDSLDECREKIDNPEFFWTKEQPSQHARSSGTDPPPAISPAGIRPLRRGTSDPAPTSRNHSSHTRSAPVPSRPSSEEAILHSLSEEDPPRSHPHGHVLPNVLSHNFHNILAGLPQLFRHKNVHSQFR